MGTAYSEEVKFVITGSIDEDIGEHNTEIFRKELELLCLKHGLDVDERSPYPDD